MGRRELMGINIWKLLLGDRSVRGFVLGRGGKKVIDSYKTDFFFKSSNYKLQEKQCLRNDK